jgi:hypothetical protein
MVWLIVVVPVPCSAMFCVAEGLALSALSVKVAVPVRLPLLCGWKLMLKLQVAPGASAKALLQSGGVPEPGTWTKFGPATINPGARAFSGWLPTF